MRIILNNEKITKPSIKKSVIENTERLRLNYKLIKLGDCAELPFNFDEIKYDYNGITTTEVLTGIGIK